MQAGHDKLPAEAENRDPDLPVVLQHQLSKTIDVIFSALAV